MGTKEEIFKKIYDSMYNELLWYAWHHLRNKSWLEDVLQETFQDVYLALDLVINIENPRAWIYTCLKNNLNEMIRKEWKYQNCISYENDLADIEIDGKDFAKEVTDREALRQVMGEENYNDIAFHYLSGYSPEEIAEIKNQNIGQYKMQFSRMKRKMEKSLKRKGFDKE